MQILCTQVLLFFRFRSHEIAAGGRQMPSILYGVFFRMLPASVLETVSTCGEIVSFTEADFKERGIAVAPGGVRLSVESTGHAAI